MEQPSVLVVEDDVVALEELTEALRGANLSCVPVTRGDEALVRLKSDKQIGVVVSDIHLPDLDGLSMLAAVHASMPSRALRCVFITGQPDYQSAVKALRLQAVDFLAKPLDVQRLVAVVSAAVVELGSPPDPGRASGAHSLASASTDAVTPLAAVMAQFSDDVAQSEEGVAEALASDEIALRHRLLLMRLMRVRSLREKFLAPGLFSDPCWEILLDVLVHQLAGRPISASSVYLATSVSATTAVRRLQDLEAAGLLRRYADPYDQRRVLVEVTEGAAKRVARYLDLLISAFTGGLAVSGQAPTGAPASAGVTSLRRT